MNVDELWLAHCRQMLESTHAHLERAQSRDDAEAIAYFYTYAKHLEARIERAQKQRRGVRMAVAA